MAEEGYEWGAYDFNWSMFSDAERKLRELIDEFTSHHDRAGEMVGSIEWGTSTKFIDWVDHMVVPEEAVDEDELLYMGFSEDAEAETMYGARCLRPRGSVLFPLLVRPGNLWELAIRVQELDDFRDRHVRTAEIMGDPFSAYRWLDVVKERDRLLTAVERRGYADFALEDGWDVDQYKSALEAFCTRRREFPSDEVGLDRTRDLVKEQLDELGTDRVAHAWLSAEWEYWESHNKAARVQKERQDHWGLGWGNHDHQAYRCSRELYPKVIAILEDMGFLRREAYFAGSQAGWGAQVLEQPACLSVVFGDVDMAPDEADFDFATEGFGPKDELGTIGLWVGLHGESMLQAGIHHMAADFALERIIQDLYTRDIDAMEPFSEFDFLKQAFTVAERWRVEEPRARGLLERGLISEEDFERFGAEGAVGSHLELTERAEGFKGFNQDSVSRIIADTDPRR